jgi:peroxiredoxin (alkyl hydroperoxide reductase subunit C)
MTIKLGDRIPSVGFTTMSAEGPRPMTSQDVFKGRKVVLFGVPGAFTPTCSAKHLPGYLAHYEALKAKGVDTVACLAVNDVYVMAAWGKDQKVGDKILMLSDGNGEFVKALGLQADLRAAGMGLRGKRFSLLADDGVVKLLYVDEGGFKLTSAEHLLEHI